MKTKLITTKLLRLLSLSAMLFVVTPMALAAEKATDNSGQMIQALEDLKSKGYVIVKDIKFDKKTDIYTAKVVSGEGKNIKIRLNPKTGDMAKDEDVVEGIPALEVAKRVAAAGYQNIYEINTEFFGNKYEVKAWKDGKTVDLKVDAKTGELIKEKAD